MRRNLFQLSLNTLVNFDFKKIAFVKKSQIYNTNNLGMCGMTKYEHGHFYKASNTVSPATKALDKLHRSCLKNIFEIDTSQTFWKHCRVKWQNKIKEQYPVSLWYQSGTAMTRDVFNTLSNIYGKTYLENNQQLKAKSCFFYHLEHVFISQERRITGEQLTTKDIDGLRY